VACIKEGIINNTDWLAILDEMDDPTQEELDAALDEMLDSVHLSAPAVALIETDEMPAPLPDPHGVAIDKN